MRERAVGVREGCGFERVLWVCKRRLWEGERVLWVCERVNRGNLIV